MDEPQKSLERYDVLDRIAVGGMAEVFLAKAYGAHGFEKTLAIKRILPELARDPEFEARFIAEAKVSVRLSHANVVQVLDFGRIGESLFIAMEYVDGLDLAAMLRKFKDEGRLVPLPAAFHIAIEIIRALDYAHQHNVVHRDVSPSNILVSRAGEVKIADFGIAVAARPHRGGGPGPKKVMGKWRYMSPEQSRGDTLDTRSDLFSAASVLYELFTGDKLFPGDEAEDIVKNIADMPIPRMAAKRSGIPSRLDDVLATALSRKPIDRPARPAIVLRQLIELSYESSIMATALDVADALATVIPAKRQSGHAALDDVIRKQLNEPTAARRTAVTKNKPPSTETAAGGEVSTGLFRKIASDGLAVLEIDDTAVAAPRAKRLSEGMPILPEGPHDPDRRTEVGGPPTGAVPKHELDAVAEGTPAKSVTSTLTGTSTTPSRRGLALGIAAVVLVGGGVGVWALTRDRGAPVDRVVEPARPIDAAVAELVGVLVIDPEPEGARGMIATADGKSTPFGPTSHARPTRLRVPSGAPIHVHIEHAGFRAFDRDITVQPSETFLVSQVLVAAQAVLHVISDPPGATVTLGGQSLGETPLTVDVGAAKAIPLVISKSGFQPFAKRVELTAGQTLDLNEKLRVEEKFGSVTIVSRPWAYVSFKGKRFGQAPTSKGPLLIRLPAGHQTLLLENPAAKKHKTVTVDVDDKTIHAYEFALD